MPNDAGCYKFNRCHACPVIHESSSFKSTSTGKIYKIRQNLSCDSAWVIYLSTCKKCKGQYVGKSKNAFKKRHSGHKQEIKNKVGGLGHHYGGLGGCGYENASFQVIEEIEFKNMEFLAEREVFWQHQLRVFVENGSRNHCYRKDMWSKFSSTQLVMTYLFNWCNFILVVKHLLSLVLSCWLADLIMDSESLWN